RHGGWVPVLVGMFLLGCGARFLDDSLDVRGSPHAAVLFVLLFPTLVNQEADWTGMLALIPGTLLVWVVAIYLTVGRKRRGAAWPGAIPRQSVRSREP